MIKRIAQTAGFSGLLAALLLTLLQSFWVSPLILQAETFETSEPAAEVVEHSHDASAVAHEHEHGYGHTAVIHSRNLETITRMGRRMNTTLFVQNGASVAGLGAGGEGYASFSIATPTGEGVTTPLTFCRKRRSSTVGSMRVV